ncbi:MAG: ABC transporter permease, partial [Acidovorax sp.]|nr:ABC transporter permease [Acidovorax sp.]
MLRVLWRVLSSLPAYLWSGWGAGASLLLLLASWEAVAALYDPLILPDPLTAFAALWAQVQQGAAGPALWA